MFECWADPQLYQPSLDFSIRDWGRRDTSIALRVTKADNLGLDALAAMFGRFDFDADDAVVRARLLYHSRVGYYALGTDEPMSARLSYLPYYLEAITGSRPRGTELDDFEAVVSNATGQVRYS